MTVRLIRVHPDDNVGVLLGPVDAGVAMIGPDGALIAQETIARGHKIALVDLPAGSAIVKYGYPIGSLDQPVRAGEWVHSHNLTTDLSEGGPQPQFSGSIAPALPLASDLTFQGYRRADGRVGTRNELWVINTVGCVNHAATIIAEQAQIRFGHLIDGAHAFVHPFGCSQLGDDLAMTQRILAGLIRHPNAGGVIVVGLGCENNQLAALMAAARGVDRARVRFFNAQEVEDEIEEGLAAAAELVDVMRHDARTPCPLSDLVIGVKCGGSDGLSGLTANPLVGRITDRTTAAGGTIILSEVPEMFGAEQHLLKRAADRATFDKANAMIEGFKRYFIDHGQPVYENPSPGNKAGGLTTLEEKSLGAVQKGGGATITQVLDYGEAVGKGGMALLRSPGNDAVSSTAEVASGATLLLFTTGRGTPLGFPVPTIKIASNDDVARRKPQWIDFSAGPLLDGIPMDSVSQTCMDLILAIASGRRLTRNEENGIREIAIWKDGVTL
ncbi:UxaA family hydrolase [Sphingobium algorifonticola]|uniref:Altronate dehydratase n=1 Tax=Sphingobium algorifonticola TaxID=2008318 RepID=A0A437J4P5_9SPHN|nr:altronate dehydratase family protein [Sphingobium algorifonticola]RVT39770.1 altronate dehydratase [Sphingobium algorifonticola]